MDVFQAIASRYSHKEGFLPDPVPLADLEKIAFAGLAAPSGANRQTVHLIILPDRQAMEQLSAITTHMGLATAPAGIVVLTNSTITPPQVMNFEKEDYAAAVENMLLAATALGYASLWLDSPYFDAEKEKAAKALLGVPDGFRIWATLPIGKPDGAGSRRDKLPHEARVFYRKFGE